MWTYRLVRAFLRLAMRVFYRQIEVVGLENVPEEGRGPVLFAGNHPNSLIDPLLLISTCGRVVHFAAKDTLFENFFFRHIFTALGAVPIRRRMDHGGTSVDNASAFERLFGVIAEGRAVGIFPEGISHDEAQLSKLKTGAARIALGARERPGEPRLVIIPCGLTYIHRRHFRSRVLVQFGPPIAVPSESVESQEAVRALTEEIEQGIRALTINAPDWETLRVLDGVRRLYQPAKIPLAHRVELARRFATVYQQVREEPEIARIFERVERYLERLEDAGFDDRDLSQPLRPMHAFLQCVEQLIWFCLWLPLAVPGIAIHAPLGLLIGLLHRRLAPRTDVTATTKLALGILLVLGAYAPIVAFAVWCHGLLLGAATLLLLPVTGYAMVRVLERTASARRVVMRLARAFVLRRERQLLILERAELETQVVAAVERFRPPDLKLLYPHGAPQGPLEAPHP